MTLVQLRHFLALAEMGSFRRAAERVFLTQPALSRSIQSLEEEWGAPLFDRVGRRVELTPFGRATLPRARRLVQDAEDLGMALQARSAGALRVGMGSGAGAMLMTPLLLHSAQDPASPRVEIARGRTELLVQALRTQLLDVLVVDARSLTPQADLAASFPHEMAGAFMVRRGHPLLKARSRRGIRFEELLRYPIASTPLSDEVSRLLVERYGPAANPADCVGLRCDEVPSLVEVVQRTDAILLAIRGAAPSLVELPMDPPLKTTAKFGLVTLAGRSEHPGVAVLRSLMDRLMVD